MSIIDARQLPPVGVGIRVMNSISDRYSVVCRGADHGYCSQAEEP